MARSADIIGNLGPIVIPTTGCYWGAEDQATGQNFTGTNGIETVLGRRMAIRRQHYSWSSGPAAMPTSFETANDALTNPKVIHMVCQRGDGNFPVVNTGGGWSSTNTSANSLGHKGMQQIVDGDFDTKFTNQFNGLKGLKNPVLYNLWFEMNGAHNNYYSLAQGTNASGQFSPGTGEAHYVAAYRHVRGLADAAGATINHGGNVIFVWCCQVENTTGWFEPYYPGDAYVDVPGLDLYRRSFSSGANQASPQVGAGNNQFFQFFSGAVGGSSAVGRGTTVKPMMVCEAGYGNGAAVKNSGATGDGVNYFKDSSPYIEDLLLSDLNGPYINFWAYVHWNESGITNNVVNQSAASLTAYKRFANNSTMLLTFAGSSGGQVPAAPVITPSTKPTNPTTAITETFNWTETSAGTVLFRWRLTTDSTVGTWNNVSTALTSGSISTPAGHTYQFEVQAQFSGGTWSASDSYTWAVNAGASVATPVITVAPTVTTGGSTQKQTAGFIWTESGGSSNYRYYIKVDTPAGAGTYPSSGQVALSYDVPGTPLGVGTYTFHVKAWNGSIFSTEATWTWTITAVAGGVPNPPVLTVKPPDPDTNTSTTFTWTES